MQREFRGHMKVLSATGDKLCRVSILALNDTVNRNGWRYINLEQHKNQFRDIPILTAYVSEGDGIGGGHNFDMKQDEDGEEYASFTAADAERIVGWVPGSAEVKVIRRDNANWIQVTGNLWRWYAREVVDKITSQPNGMDVSIETLVTKEHTEPDGTEVEEEYTVLGITVLGNGSRPAVKGAGIRKLNAVREAMKEAVAQAEKFNTEEENLLEQKDNSAEMAETAEPAVESTEAAGVRRDGSFDTTSGVNENHPSDTFEELQRENEALKTRLQSLEAEQAKWLQREKKHRCEAAVAVVADELRELNEPREAEARFDEAICEALIARCNAGEFSDIENADGEWIGAEMIRNEVRALCMQAQHEMDITHASAVTPPRRGSCQHGMLTEGAQKDNYENICSASSRDPSPLRGASLAQGSPYKPAGEPLSWSLPAQPETNHETVVDRLINNRGEF